MSEIDEILEEITPFLEKREKERDIADEIRFLGYILETFEGLPSIKWDREGKFRGDVQVKVIKA